MSNREAKRPALGNESPKTVAVAEPVLQLDRRSACYQPGEELNAKLALPAKLATSLRAIELSLVWFTVGKGDEDLHVCRFQRNALATLPQTEQQLHWELDAVLPASPLSYDGRIVKLCWAVRARLFGQEGKVQLIELPLRLGGVAPASASEESPPAHQEFSA